MVRRESKETASARADEILFTPTGGAEGKQMIAIVSPEKKSKKVGEEQKNEEENKELSSQTV